jgi:hypothetical protein
MVESPAMSVQRQAACACGQLKVRVSGEPQLVSSCHCLACQRRTGSLFGTQAFFKREQVAAIEGNHRIFGRRADSGTTVNHAFCPDCGSTVFWERASLPGMISIAVGAFADPRFPPPARTVWTESQHRWLSFPEDIPQHRRNPS